MIEPRPLKIGVFPVTSRVHVSLIKKIKKRGFRWGSADLRGPGETYGV